MFKVIALSIILSACSGPRSQRDLHDIIGIERVKIAYETKLAELAALAHEPEGWLSRDCDGLLWNGLASYAGHQVNIKLAEYEPGVWHRRPPPACYDDGDQGSKSTISNDMFLGLFWALYGAKDQHTLEDLASYGEAKDWVMGKPWPDEIGRVLLRPNQVAALGKMLYIISQGVVDKDYRLSPVAYAPAQEDYGRHLSALGIGLHGQLDGEISENMFDELKRIAGVEPENHLFEYLKARYDDGSLKRTLHLLNYSEYLPSYVRGENLAALRLVYWLFTARLVLNAVD